MLAGREGRHQEEQRQEQEQEQETAAVVVALRERGICGPCSVQQEATQRNSSRQQDPQPNTYHSTTTSTHFLRLPRREVGSPSISAFLSVIRHFQGWHPPALAKAKTTTNLPLPRPLPNQVATRREAQTFRRRHFSLYPDLSKSACYRHTARIFPP